MWNSCCATDVRARVFWKRKRAIPLPPRKTKETFESRLQTLEEILHKMESGDMPLADTLKAYEDGMKLAKELDGELSQAEKRMQELSGGTVSDMEDAP